MLEYIVSNDVVVHIGQNAKENDILTQSSNPKHWWMHASGYPGAHVVLQYEGDEVPREMKRDAAVLAIHHSKTLDTQMSWVDMTRVENVNACKHYGRVTLTGKVDQLTIFMRKEKQRLERILKTQRVAKDSVII
jgi:predicted ribosome quality control (RQC) complex YloA/Tae2 family protein|tara:strand:- start:673 stop:1074 length:402 start_codon:yes stop_codon:yes gene_type:complete